MSEVKAFNDKTAEISVLSGVFRHGYDSFIDVSDLIDANVFSDNFNSALYKCFEHHYREGDKPLDLPSILSAAKSVGVYDIINQPEEKRHLRAYQNFPVERETVRREAGKLVKLRIAEVLDEISAQARRDLRKLTGDETLNQIVNVLESPLFEYVAKLNSSEMEGPRHIAYGVDEYLDSLENNPRDIIGISSGFGIYDTCIGGGYRRGTVNIVAARPKTGKALINSAYVYTPTGPKTIASIKVGDNVSTPSGTFTTVVGCFPQGMRDIYRVVFSDGDSVECDGDHLWEVFGRRNNNKTPRLKTSLEIMEDIREGDGRPKWSVRLPDHTHYDAQPVLMDPYLLGYLIGNGSLSNGIVGVTIPDIETVNRLKSIIASDHELIQRDNPIRYDIVNRRDDNRNFYISQLKQLGLIGKTSHRKFIPETYKYNSLEVRWAVLQGWLDADGGVSNKRTGNIEGSTTSSRLAADIKDLVQSLGGLCRIVPRTTTCNGKSFDSFRLHIRFNDNTTCFRLSRKAFLTKRRTKPPLKRTIDRIEYVGKKDATCIKLATDAGLFMTDHHIVTHNTVWCDNVALHVAGVLKVPVLNLDTEMSREEHLARILAHLSSVPIKEIENGTYGKDPSKRQAVRQAAAYLKTIPYEYESVINKSFEEQVATIRRWTLKNVGVDESGKTKDCLVVYDYLQLTDASEFGGGDFKEYQILGFQMLSLLRLAARCDIPILSMLQLNREGIDKETTGTAAGSDRIIWKCANFSILKRKTEEELAEDGGEEEGNLKLVPVIARHGEALAPQDYINLKFEGKTATLKEGRTRNEVAKSKKSTSSGSFEVEYDEEEPEKEKPQRRGRRKRKEEPSFE